MSHSNQRNFDEWEIIREELLGLIRIKQHEKVWLMRKGVYLLVSIHDEIPEAAPLNYTDRLNYRVQYRKTCRIFQLDELFKESKKKIARIRAQNKNG